MSKCLLCKAAVQNHIGGLVVVVHCTGRGAVALGGFFQYNGMTLERFLLAYIRTEFIYPHRLVFKSDNLYAKLMERSSMKEALKID